ncbi:MAG: hypothetical protein HY903_20935 [Deltaproteobacteria bacterium]|nr:hypothetical protein [Deltaproteobacteria bacterium]
MNRTQICVPASARSRLATVVVLGAIGSASGCGATAEVAVGDGLGAGEAASAGGLSYSADARQIYSINWRGTDICDKSRVDCLMVIGSCSGADTPGNVRSTDSDGHTLLAPGSCPGSPFSFRVTGSNPIHASISVGPLVTDYALLSVPLCMTPEHFSTYTVSVARHEEGCGASWRSRANNGGLLSSIWSPCRLVYDGKYLGQVGQARVRPSAVGQWAELDGGKAKIHAAITAGNPHVLAITNHPYTYCIEPGWERLSRGSTVTLEMDISFSDPGATPPPPPDPPPPPPPPQGTADAASLVAVNVPASGVAGSQVSVSVTVKNTGTATWSEPANHLGGTRLGSIAPGTVTWVVGAGGWSRSLTDQRAYVPASVAPGASVTFSFPIKLPAAAGSATFAAQMVHDGVTWFGPTITKAITVTGGGTPPPVSGSLVFEAEGAGMGHVVGRAESGGWAAATALDAPGHMLFGPYTTAVTVGHHTATFRLLVDNNTADNLRVVRLEVYDYTANRMLGATRDVHRRDLSAAFQYQDFAVGFDVPTAGHQLEFRVYWDDTSYVKVDKVSVN